MWTRSVNFHGRAQHSWRRAHCSAGFRYSSEPPKPTPNYLSYGLTVSFVQHRYINVRWGDSRWRVGLCPLGRHIRVTIPVSWLDPAQVTCTLQVSRLKNVIVDEICSEWPKLYKPKARFRPNVVFIPFKMTLGSLHELNYKFIPIWQHGGKCTMSTPSTCQLELCISSCYFLPPHVSAISICSVILLRIQIHCVNELCLCKIV